MQTGVSTSSLFPLETEKALRRLGEIGVHRAEIFLNSPCESYPKFIDELRRIAEGEGIEIASLHPYCSDTEGVLFFGHYPRRFTDGMDEYRRMFDACNVLGAKKLIFHGARSGLNVPWELYFERYAQVAEEAARHSVLLCQENVARCCSCSIDMIRAMRSALPQARFVLDTKQALRSGVSPFALAEAMGAALAHVHISDYSDKCDCIIPGQGVFDFAAFLRQISDRGFAGDIMLELYRWNFDTDEQLVDGKRVIDAALESIAPAVREGAAQ